MSTATVLIRLAAPMQSWAGHPRESQIRPTNDHPTKRGVIGLVANVCGRDWHDDVSDLASLRFGVRSDRPGVIDSDYQTAGGGHMPLLPGEVMANPKWRKAATKHDPTSPDFPAVYTPPKNITVDKDGTPVGSPGPSSLTHVHYIADAVFTAALTGDAAVATAVADALQAPARTPFLGRAAYLPSEPLFLAVTDDDTPAAALARWPLHPHATSGPVSVWTEVPPFTPGSTVVDDQPVDYRTRQSVGRAELHTTLTPNGEIDEAGELSEGMLAKIREPRGPRAVLADLPPAAFLNPSEALDDEPDTDFFTDLP